ncbi:MAG: glutamate synthase-related protein [Thermodesulfobacteriota bacterium]
MPAKFAIHPETARPRFRPVGKLGIVDWREDCSGCHNCVKRDCVYRLYRDESDSLREEAGYLDYIYQCKGCLNCVQNCTKNILTRVVNPEYRRLGDAYYTPDLILSTWYQAETGKIPVSGAGYGGPFSGPGFDSMWTDMSEIVRPTRDGIHGREYISTSVDIGRKLPHLTFSGDGRLSVEPPPLAEIPLPVIFDVIPRHWRRGPVVPAVAAAAAELGTMAVLREPDFREILPSARGRAIPFLSSSSGAAAPRERSAPVVMIPDGPEAAAARASLKREQPAGIVAVRVPAGPDAAKRAAELARDGTEVIHLEFDSHGREQGGDSPRHLRDVLREAHGELVRSGIRDEVTLIASGGIALAEHVAKAILCGADLVAIDVPLLLALECRLCGECRSGRSCPVALEEADADFCVRRIVNLMSSWHSQLLEMMGAMGIREARRLRGETGRCMFFEDLERDTFGRLFGKRKD